MPKRKNPKFSKKDQKNLNKLVRDNAAEQRVFNDNTILGAIAAGGTVQSMCNTIQGIDNEHRLGDSIANCSWDVNYTIVGTVNDSYARVIFFQDHDNIGTAPVTADLLTTAKVVSTFDSENVTAKRFRILYDRIHHISVGTETELHSVMHKRFKVKRINYTGAAANSESSDSVYCLVIKTDAVAGSVGVATIDLDFQLKFNP